METPEETRQHFDLRSVIGGGLRLIAKLVRWHPWSFFLAVVGAGLFVSAIVAAAYVIGRVTDQVIIPILDEGEPSEGTVTIAVVAIVGVALGKAAGIVLRRCGASWLQSAVRRDARRKLIDHQLKLDLSWHDRRATGDLLSISEVDTLQGTFVLAPLPYATGASFLLIAAIVVVTLTDGVLGLIVCAGLTAVVAVDVAGAAVMFDMFERVQEQRGVLGEIAHESFDGALTVKALGREADEVARFRAGTEVLRRRLIEVMTLWASFRAVTESIPAVITVVVLIVGSLRIATGAISPGELVSVAYLITLMTLPMQLVGFVVWEMAFSSAAWRRVQEILDADELVAHGELSGSGEATGGAVAGAGVSFGYTPDELVLGDVSIDIPPGKVVAIVGPTGSGKSTLAVLMARLWDPHTGHITIDGRDVRDFARSQLATEVAFVSQEAFLFDDTVTGNITLGFPFSEQDVQRAAGLAGVDRFVHELPDGFATRLGERGTSLSGGQRQRVALARALARRPRVMILDDATSAVDPTVEAEILRGLRRADLPSTVVIVAYRPSSISLADEVVFVEQGTVVAQGPPAVLLETVPGYARLITAYEEDAARRAVEARA
jgi:ABC-type multidrug transport system fused ATPase/permease subunit